MKYFFIRMCSFLILSGMWYFGILFLAVPATLLYVYHYRAYELPLLGILLDIQFLVATIPWYAIVFSVFFVASELLKPLLRRTNHTIL